MSDEIFETAAECRGFCLRKENGSYEDMFLRESKAVFDEYKTLDPRLSENKTEALNAILEKFTPQEALDVFIEVFKLDFYSLPAKLNILHNLLIENEKSADDIHKP